MQHTFDYSFDIRVVLCELTLDTGYCPSTLKYRYFNSRSVDPRWDLSDSDCPIARYECIQTSSSESIDLCTDTTVARWSSSGGYLSISTNSMTDLVVGATFEMTIRAYSVPDSQFSDCSF